MEYTIITFYFFILCFTSFAISPAKCSSNETDLHALLNFRAGIDHDPFGFLNSWNGTSHFCTWNGVQCSRKHRNRVVAIDLLSQGLSGSLSPHIGNLSFLRTITLKNNTFRGRIPQEIGRLRRLESINLSNNSFIGEIPRNLSQCLNLVFLNLLDNRLSGIIPPELGSLSKLGELYLSKNNLSGRIPPMIGNLTSLTRLSLSQMGLEGEIPDSFPQLRSLTYLNLGVNRLTGRVPSGLFNISSITLFAIHANQLEGQVPCHLGLTLPNVRELYLGGNRFTGPVPVSLPNATFLEEIVLIMNNFTGPMPKVGVLLNLQTFTIALNHIHDDISIFISSLTNCTNLQLLEIGDNVLTGSLPNSIANLSSNLWTLMIPDAQIHGKIPSGIENLVGLTRFDFSGNFLEGRIPSGIGKLYNLGQIDMGRNRFTNELPSSFSNLTLLNLIALSENNLSGSIAMLGNCSNLLQIYLSHNNFNGSIPREIMNLQSISISFDLSYNSFEGSIPSQVGSLSNLVSLDLSNNRLSGLIPSSLSGCTSLELLYLEGNSLEGEIPSRLSALMGLRELDLSRNNLFGPIPSFLGNLRLEKLNLSYNRLQGEVPTRGIFRNTTVTFLDGNVGLCGGIHELKLPLCSFAGSSQKTSSTIKKILIPAGAILLTAIFLIIFLYRRRATKKDSSTPSVTDKQFLRLSYADLLKATDGFSEPMLIGKGQFGSVYKGIIDDGQTFIAVKVLNLSVRGASKSFMAECNALRGLRHRNLLKILSVCESIDFQGNDFKALVYEFKANGSLEKWLYRSNVEEREGGNDNAGIRRLNMLQRLSIAIDIAQAIEYLHGGTDSSVVHCDLKPSNILLDGDLTAYVGDFGLAKIMSSMVSVDESSGSVVIKGTIGYVAPEYATNHSVTTQGDIYSYGILLLEMFTNKRPTDEEFRDHVTLHSFVSDALRDNAMEIVDPLILREDVLNSSKIKDCVVSVLSIAVACSRTTPRDRILMTDVVKQLHKIKDFYLSEDFR